MKGIRVTTYQYYVILFLESNLYSETIIDDELKEIEKTLVDGGFINSKLVITDCEGLINAPSKNEEVIDIIEYQKTFKYITDTDNTTKLNGYISIVNGLDIAELVRKHQSAIFEANIRDYFKRNDLNSKIIATSSDKQESKFFWSYNNGLTMTCSKVEEMPNNKYKLHNLQIVNGCQTSNAIYQAVKNKERVSELNKKIEDRKELTKRESEELAKIRTLQFFDNTSILVKIIETKDEDLIYKITETTNSQTPIKAFSLRANDDIQKLIEKFLEDYDVAYERRINSLRNKGKKNVISIQRLFQLFTSQIQFKPSQVKTRPKTMFINTYDDVFPAINVRSINYVLYLIPIKVDFALNKAVKEYLQSNPNLDSYKKTLISYGKLHLGLFMLSSILRFEYNEKGIVKNEEKILSELEENYLMHFEDAIENFEKVMKLFSGNKKESIPIMIRKSELDSRVAKYIKSRK